MKKKLLPLAMLAGLAGAAGTAQAAYLNSDGLGEALIYPFYSVEGGQDTYFTVVNTTNLTKAVKVRIIEAMNSQEVLDFNLYLSPFDHWSAAITTTADGARLITGDNSCTVPRIKNNPAYPNGIPFRNFEYNQDGGPTALSRTREGYIEVLEMGVLDDDAPDVPAPGGGDDIASFDAEAAALHGSNGVPESCETLVNAWIAAGTGDGTGEWAQVNINGQVLPPAQQGNPAANFATDSDLLGGLYGYGVLINVEEGTNATYSAIAMDAFFASTPQHTDSGFVTPSLGGANSVATIFDSTDGTTQTLLYAEGWDAVSALFMHDTISNDYIMAPEIAAGTDWVITMPTKRYYVNDHVVGAGDEEEPIALPPFLTPWENGRACEEVQISYWDREEQVTSAPPVPGDVDFSPRPPFVDETVTGFALCSEVSVISFLNPDAVIEDDEIVSGYVSALYPSSRIQYGFQTEFYNGWARLSLAADNDGNERELVDLNDVTLTGLPAIGFAVQKYSNTDVEGVGDAGAFYSGLIEHKYTRLITSQP